MECRPRSGRWPSRSPGVGRALGESRLGRVPPDWSGLGGCLIWLVRARRYVPAFEGRWFRQVLATNPSRPGRAQPGQLDVEYVSAPRRWAPTWTGSTISTVGGPDVRGPPGRRRHRGMGHHPHRRRALPQVVTSGLLLDMADSAASTASRGRGDHARRHRGGPVTARVSACTRRCGAVPHRLGSPMGSRRRGVRDGEPGPGSALAMARRPRCLMTGCDTWSFGPVPPEDPDLPFVVPQTLNADHGIVVLENLRLEPNWPPPTPRVPVRRLSRQAARRHGCVGGSDV